MALSLRKGRQKKKPAIDPAEDEPKLVKRPRAAEILAISIPHLSNRTAPRGPIPCVRIGRSVRYNVESLRQFAAQGGAAR
jgi:hypothetical protein